MKYRDLLFDADDTLFDFPQASDRAFSCLCQTHHLPDTPESRRLFVEVNADLWKAFEEGTISKEYLVVERFVRFLAALGETRNAADCNETYLAGLGQGVFPLPHAEEVCRRLSKTHRLYLVTNAVASVQRSRLQNSAFAPYFSGSFISEEAGASKPDPAYFAYVLSQIPDCIPERCLVIGDSLTTDMRGANNANLPCCWYNPSHKPAPDTLRIDYEIHDLRELWDIV